MVHLQNKTIFLVIILRNTLLGNIIIHFIKQICWNSGHVNLTVSNTVLLDIWWNMFIKFSIQIGNSLAKIINKKVNSRPCEISEMKLSRRLLLASRANSGSCQTSDMDLLPKIVKNENLHLGCLTRFWICFWIGFQSYGCFFF